jgi:hypothetical protein
LERLVANSVCPYLLQQKFTHNGATDFRSLFLVPMFAALLAAVALALLLSTRRRSGRPQPQSKTPIPA